MEEWKKFRDSIYSVSNRGRVRNDIKNTILTPYSNQFGRMLVDFRSTLGKCFQVHRVVAEVFIGEPGKLEVNHRDGNTKNNSLENLEYVTAKENMRHAVENGLCQKKNLKKFQNTREEMFRLKSEGHNQAQIAKILAVDASHVSRTLRGKTNARINNQGVTL